MSMIDLKGRTSKKNSSVRKPLREMKKPSKPDKVKAGSKWKLMSTSKPLAKEKVSARPKRGVQQDKQRKKFNFSRFFGFIKTSAIALSVAFVVAGSVYFGKEFVQQASSRPINSVGIEGKFVYLDKQSVSDMIAPMIKAGFLQMPISAIKSKLEENPWIDSALVSRRWPDTLYVSITEQEPIARWSTVGFLNAKGQVIFVKQPAHLAHLPLLGGEATEAKRVMQDFQELSQLLRPYDLTVKQFYSDELSSWSVMLDNDIVITLGRDQIMEKLQRFLTVYATSLQTQIDQVAGVDLRYGNGVAVKWKESAAVEGATVNGPGGNSSTSLRNSTTKNSATENKKRVPHA